MSYRKALLIALAILVLAVASVFIPAYLIRPFTAQTREGVQISYYLRTWAPVLNVLFLAAALFVSIRYWRTASHWFKKAVLVAIVLIIGAGSWLSFQNYFEWMFNPLPNPNYTRAEEVKFITGKDMVLTVSHAGDSVAYPVRLLAYHHLVHDTVGGKPIVATY